MQFELALQNYQEPLASLGEVKENYYFYFDSKSRRFEVQGQALGVESLSSWIATGVAPVSQAVLDMEAVCRAKAAELELSLKRPATLKRPVVTLEAPQQASRSGTSRP